MPDKSPEPKLTEREKFALARYYVRMLRIIADEQLYQREMLEDLCQALLVDTSEHK